MSGGSHTFYWKDVFISVLLQFLGQIDMRNTKELQI